jgi:hypothetical protein
LRAPLERLTALDRSFLGLPQRPAQPSSRRPSARRRTAFFTAAFRAAFFAGLLASFLADARLAPARRRGAPISCQRFACCRLFLRCHRYVSSAGWWLVLRES